MTPRIPEASVHGRFQPFHNEHLEYVLRAFDHADFLHIGITQFSTRMINVPDAGDHRASSSGNPLTYAERTHAIRLALHSHEISPSRYSTMPFPIESPDDLENFLPRSVQILTTRVDAWNDYKIDLLRSRGYVVEVLYERDPKGVSGDQVRKLMSAGDALWETLVPASTVRYLKSLGLSDRLTSGDDA